MSQTERLLKYLRCHPEGITPLEALETIGTMRLAARVADLRASGYTITAEDVSVNGKRFARYHLVEADYVQLAAFG